MYLNNIITLSVGFFLLFFFFMSILWGSPKKIVHKQLAVKRYTAFQKVLRVVNIFMYNSQTLYYIIKFYQCDYGGFQDFNS